MLRPALQAYSTRWHSLPLLHRKVQAALFLATYRRIRRVVKREWQRHSGPAFRPDYLAFTVARTYNLIALSVSPRSSLVQMKLRLVRWFLAPLSFAAVCCCWMAAQSPAPAADTAAPSPAQAAPAKALCGTSGQTTTPADAGQTAAQTTKGTAAPSQGQAADQPDPLKRHADTGPKEEKFQGTQARVERHLQEVAERGRRLHHHAGRSRGLQAAVQRRGA